MAPANRIAAVLLAAGSSRRFGADNKLLAELDGKPLVRHAAERLAQVGFQELICVTGPDRAVVTSLLDGLRFRFVHNERYTEGMGGSVATGIRAVGSNAIGALVCLGDMPRLPLTLLDRLISTFMESRCDRIVYPSLSDGSQRNPVLWPRRLFDELGALSGEIGAKSILKAHAAETVPVAADVNDFVDIDTVDDLRQLQSERPD